MIEQYFRFRCQKGLAKKGLADKPEYVQRMEREINVISKMGFCDYFLIVSDLLSWARKNNIPHGPGRGSAAGSIVSYLLEITHLDPIKYDLIFERFLNEGRIGPPIIEVTELSLVEFEKNILPTIDPDIFLE